MVEEVSVESTGMTLHDSILVFDGSGDSKDNYHGLTGQ